MTPCQRPLDSIDAEAIACGADPVLAGDAARHAAQCSPCQGRVDAARAFLEALEGLSASSEPVAGLADRVTRLRAFSRRERLTYALWNAPVLLTAGLAGSGLGLLTLPDVLTASEQISLGAVAAAPVAALLRSAFRWVADLLSLAPVGLEALSQGLRREGSLGLAALVLLVPLGLGLSRVLSRASGRR